MANGISGDAPNVGAQPDIAMILIEVRTQTTLLQEYLATGLSIGDHLGRIRNDQAFELGIPTPLPGAGR